MNICYTAIFAEYDKLNEPLIITPGWRYICFSDKPIYSKNWTVILHPIEEKSAQKQARRIKILPHEYFPNLDNSIWVDGRVTINCNLNNFLGNSILLMKHNERNCIYDEAWTCMESKKDEPHKIIQQIHRYKKDKYPVNNGLVATGFIFRRNTLKMHNFCKSWWNEVNNYSIRDQISFNYTIPYFNQDFILNKHA
jgi:hypothetical protein